MNGKLKSGIQWTSIAAICAVLMFAYNVFRDVRTKTILDATLAEKVATIEAEQKRRGPLVLETLPKLVGEVGELKNSITQLVSSQDRLTKRVDEFVTIVIQEQSTHHKEERHD